MAIGINADKFAFEVRVNTRLNGPLYTEKWKEVDDGIKDKIRDLTLVSH